MPLDERTCPTAFAARNHYGEVDLEPFKLNLMQALDIAEGRIEACYNATSSDVVA